MSRRKSRRKSPSVEPRRPLKAYRNMEFIESPHARPVRILAEFIEPQMRFRQHKVHDTIVFFGSARVLSPEAAAAAVSEAQALPPSSERDSRMEVTQRGLWMSRYYLEAMQLAQMLTEWSRNLKGTKRRFIVCSGGGPGIMEAANRGAWAAGGPSIGFNISIPFEQHANNYITPGLNFEFHYFFIRKYWFAYMAKALIVFPGGFGTLDELAELVTLLQTEKIKKRVPIVIYGRAFWKEVVHFEKMVEFGTISPADMKLFRFCDTPKEAFDYLTEELSRNHLS